MSKRNKKKTHSGIKKRFKLSKSGKIKFTKTKRRHLLTKKSQKLKQHLREAGYLKTCDTKHIRPLL